MTDKPSNVTTRPDPDPTVLTTQQSQREIAALKELMQARIEGERESSRLREKFLDAIPNSIREAVLTLRELHDEKFKSIDKQFSERDTRVEQSSRDTKTAIDAALQAQKEAAGKSELAFTKLIDQMGALFSQATGAMNGKIDDLKERMTAGEGHKKGMGEGWAILIAAIGAVGVLIGIAGVGLAFMRASGR